MAITFRLSTKCIIKLNINSLSLTYTHYNLELNKYSEESSSFLASTLRSYGITPALYNNNNLGSQLINNKIDKIDKLDK